MHAFYVGFMILAKNFLTNLFAYMQAELTTYNDIVKIQAAANKGFIFSSQSTSVYSTSLSKLYAIMNNTTMQLANGFGQAGDDYNVLRQAMISAGV